MKTRNLLVLLSVIFFGANNLLATELVVQHNGPVGTYASIAAAITAAVDNDIIVINNRQDGLPWAENITIAKSLTFVSAVDNTQWWMEGNIIFTASDSRVITIVGMRNSLASATLTRNGSAASVRTLINLLYCDIAGDVSIVSHSNLHIGSSKVGNVTFSFGKIVGNDLRSLTCSPDIQSTNDVNMIIGNRIGYWFTSTAPFAHTNNTQYLFFSNNLVKASSSTGSVVSALKAGSVQNRIINSSFVSTYIGTNTPTAASFYLSSTGGLLTLENSTFGGNFNPSATASGANGIVIASTSTTSLTPLYNIYYNPPILTNDGSTLTTSLGNFAGSTSINAANISTTGLIPGSSHVNLGNPSNSALDLDLTRNDIGVFGGSYSMENFLPLMTNAESSRVNYAVTPRVVNQGGVMNVQAIGFDK